MQTKTVLAPWPCPREKRTRTLLVLEALLLPRPHRRRGRQRPRCRRGRQSPAVTAGKDDAGADHIVLLFPMDRV